MNELEQYFIYKCEKGLVERGLADKQEYQDRLKYEIEVILKTGFSGYFLIVQDFVNWAKNNDIYVGPGRGSGAGSLCCYCLGITNLDPIRWGLIFERFLNPGRVSMPDLDLDFEKRYRDRVIDYVTKKYGGEKVAHIGTFNLMRAKAAVRNVVRVLGEPYAVGDELSKLLLPPIHGKPQDLSTSINKVNELLAYYNHPECTQGKVLRKAKEVENSISSVGVHASGVVISNESLLESVPLFIGRGGEVTTQWEMNNIEEVGLIKFDFLGLDALTKIHRCIDLIKERHDKEIDIDNIDLDDPKVYINLRSGDAMGIFQLEASSGMRDLLVQIRPTTLEDLIALVAIYRPGPLGSDYKEVYLGVRAGNREPEYLVPELEPILEPTAGWIIYQEQAMRIATDLCGYTMAEADDLRKAIGKKKEKLMAKHESIFKEGWIKNNLPKDKVNELWNQIVDFASYAFNRSHAASYAYITYQTAWLKTHYPKEFMCAVMVCDSGNQDQMIKYLAECKKLGFNVLPPDINRSKESFHVDYDDDIRFGLAPIKNLGESPVSTIMEVRGEENFRGLENFCSRVNLGVINRLKLESLIKAGAFDEFGHTRASMLEAVEAIWDYRKDHKAYQKKLETFHKKVEAFEQRQRDVESNVLSEKGKKLKPLKFPTKPEEPVFPVIQDVSEMPKHDLQAAEHELLGFYVSSHPLDGINNGSTFNGRFNTIEEIKKLRAKTKVTLAAVIANRHEITTKRNKQKMAFLSLEDLTGSLEAVCFPNTYNKCKDLIEETRPLRVEGIVEVTETDDGRVSKLIVYNLCLFDKQEVKAERIKTTVGIAKAKELIILLNRFAGDVHTVDIYLEARDGTKFRVPRTYKIGDFKGGFQREISRLNYESGLYDG